MTDFKIPFVPDKYQDIAFFAAIFAGGLLLTGAVKLKRGKGLKRKVTPEDVKEAHEAFVLAYKNNESPEVLKELNSAIKEEYGFSFSVSKEKAKLIARDGDGSAIKSYKLTPESVERLAVINA